MTKTDKISKRLIRKHSKISMHLPILCSYCSKEFKYESEKKRHEQSHIPQFECKQCCKTFSFLSALRRHQKQHERTGSVACSTCGRNFRDDALLKRHIKYAHKDTNICTKCSAKFNSELALSSHMKSHKPKSERRFKCKYSGCDKSFNFTHHLRHHELTHSDEKQYDCKICGKGFIQFHHFKAHIKSHVSKDSFYCPIQGCNKKFLTEYSRKRHLATHKNTVDSGISSDSNGDVTQESAKGSIFCAVCGQLVPLSLYQTHKDNCSSKEDKPKDLSVVQLSNTELHCNQNNEPEISTCKTILGRCIVGDSEDSTCLCDQIKTDIQFRDITSPIGQTVNESVESIDNKRLSGNTCERCDCTTMKGCGFVDSNSKPDLNRDFPHIEYRNDGVIKIKDTFDIEISDIISVKNGTKFNGNDEIFKSNNFVPYNSCKAVLGKCIVSGNGTISEECLCAKMALDEEQIIEQEIDEITPQPVI